MRQNSERFLGGIQTKWPATGEHQPEDHCQRELIGARIQPVARAFACSGDMYAGVPIRAMGRVLTSPSSRQQLGDAKIQHLHKVRGRGRFG